MINALSNAISGLFASQKRLEVSAQNIANAGNAGKTTGDSGTKSYNARTVIQTPLVDQDGQVIGTQATPTEKNPPTQTVYNPSSPLADDSGYITIPNVNLVEEALHISLAGLTFEANARIINAVEDLSLATINLIDQ